MMNQLVFLIVLTAACTPIAWGLMWLAATKHNREYIKFIVNKLECGNSGKEEADESAKESSHKGGYRRRQE